MMSICTDAQGRVTGVCPDNLTGGNGWTWMDTDLTPHTELYDANGVPLYKIVDGTIVQCTPQEIAADTPEPEEPAPSSEELLQTLAENVNDAMLAIMYLSIE